MAKSAKSIIAALEAFVAKDDCEDEWVLNDILKGFGKIANRERILPAIFAVMERYPEADLGTPGPLVHSIEEFPISLFEPFLRASVQKQPGQLNVWMVNRILNTKLSSQHRAELLKLLNEVKSNPRASAGMKEIVRGFIKHQQEQREK